ncbi:hypothetical protein WJT86_12000 [Microvirga sp. W0021]|uniref:DUF7660 domain-containing protein n=1 Tax=Hohaiivirga grylli TaxID=3133970 RepID=A0ABV0BPS5_9HYPH
MKTVIETLNEISTKEQLAEHISSLRLSLEHEPNSWENISLEQYLEAMEAWILDIDGYAKNLSDEAVLSPSGATFAKILSAAKVYE